MISAIIKQFGKLWILDIWNEDLYPICIKNLFCKIILNDYKLSTVRARLICNIRQVDVLIELEDERSKGNLYPGKRTPNNIEDDGEDFDFRIMKEAFPEYIR